MITLPHAEISLTQAQETTEPVVRHVITLPGRDDKPARTLYLYDGSAADIPEMTRIANAAVQAGTYPHRNRILDYFNKELSILTDLGAAMDAGGIFYIVKESSGRTVGFFAANPREAQELSPEPFWNLNKLYLLPDAQGGGLGRRLMELGMQEGINRGYKLLYLQTVLDFENAIALYEKIGFQRIPNCLVWDDPICVEMIYRVG